MNERREFSLDELDIPGIIKDVIKNFWLVILAAVTCYLIVTSVMKVNYRAEYSSTATFAIMAKGSAGSTFASLTTASSMADVLAEVFQSNVLKSKVADDLNMEVFQGNITSEVVNETNLLLLTVTASDPRTAYFGIQSVINNYNSVSEYIFGNAVMEIISTPQISIYPSNPLNIGKMQKMAAFAGALLMCLILAAMSIMRNTVKTRKTAVRRLDGKYLGMAPHEEKNRTFKSRIHNYNKSVLITNPICSFAFSEAIQKLNVRIEYHMRKNNQKILMVTSIAENEGKTTVAANLALALAAKGHRVLVIDMDLRKPAVHKIFEKNIEKDEGFSIVLEDVKNIRKALVYDEKNHIYLLMNRKGYSDSQDILTSDKISVLMDFCRKYMDYVIIDTPPVRVSSDAEIITSYVDAAMLVVRQDWVDIRDINDGMDLLKKGNGEFMGYVLNNVYERKRKNTAYNYSSVSSAGKKEPSRN